MNGKMNATHFMDVLQAEGSALLIRHGKDAATAQMKSEELVFRILEQIGGTSLYIKKDVHNRIRRHHVAIRDDYKATTETIEELALKYGMSNRHIYSIVTAARDLTNSKIQTSNSAIRCIAIEAARMMIEIGILPDVAANAACVLIGAIAAKFGGKVLYIPKAAYLKAERKHAEIWRQHQAGVSFEGLAIRFDLSERQIRCIISRHSGRNKAEMSVAGLSQLRRRIFDVAASCKGVNSEVDGLLASAVDSVNRALNISMSPGKVDT